MISRTDVEAAWHRIRPYVRRTPVLELAAGSFGIAAPLALKLESLQVSGSFKGRGAFHKLLVAQVPAAGVIAASGGNHGAAVAYAARALGHKAEIFVPTIAAPAKVARLESYGCTVHQVGAVYAEARAASETRAAETGALVVHAYEDPEVFAGAGRPVDVAISGLAADALGASRIGAPNFEIARKLVARSLLVSDDAVRVAQRALWDNLRLISEPAGATGLAALLSGTYFPEEAERVAVLICGANTEPGSAATS